MKFIPKLPLQMHFTDMSQFVSLLTFTITPCSELSWPNKEQCKWQLNAFKRTVTQICHISKDNAYLTSTNLSLDYL